MENLSNLSKNQNITWNNIKNFLEKQNTDKETIDKVYSVFLNFDFTMDETLGTEELQKLNELLTQFDTDKNGKLSEDEINAGESIFKTLGVEITNKFTEAVNNAEVSQETADIPQSTEVSEETAEENSVTDKPIKEDKPQIDYEKDKDGNIITYPLEGESFRKTASRLGFKYGTDEYKTFLDANKKAGNRKWFIVGEKVKIPPELFEKSVKEELIDKAKSDEQVERFNKHYMPQKTSTSAQKSVVPKSIQNEMAKHKDCTLTSDKNGHILRAERENDTAFTEYNYDLKGNLTSQKTGYPDGRTVETYFENGVKKTRLISKAAALPIQEHVQKMKQISGGDAYLEYDSNSKNYVCVQKGVKNSEVKEIRTMLAVNKQEVEPTRFEKFKSWFGIQPDKKYTEEVITLSEITTNKNGKITKGEYKDGKLLRNTVIKQADVQQSAPQNKKIYTNADISFEMPAGAPKAAQEFCNALVDSKERLMLQLGIDNDTYNMLAQTAVGIAGKETKFDQYWVREDDGSFKMDIDSINFRNLGKNIVNSIGMMRPIKWIKGDKSEISRGMTQLKFDLHIKEQEIKKNMEAFGITDKSQLDDPRTSAVATVIVLSTLNKRLNNDKYKDGIETAQGINVENEGWELDDKGIAKKTGNTTAWTNKITQQDSLCALWVGGNTAKSLINGKFEPQSWAYTREVREITNKYVLHENKDSRKQAEVRYEESRPFEQKGNNGDMGSVVFLPGMYADRAKHINTPSEIQKLNQTLIKKGIDSNTRNQLISALQNGELGFDFGLRQSEIDSLTTPDIKLMLQSLHKLKNNLKINTSDGITSTEAEQLRKRGSEISKAEDEFRKEYLTRHSKVYNVSDTNNKVLRETSTYDSTSSYVGINNQRRGFQHEKSKGVNINTTSGRISKQNEILALAAAEVVNENPNNINSGNCLTGVKKALKNAGIDTSEMIKEGSIPKFAKNWFAKHPEMFTPVEYVAANNGTAREINLSDINMLPAGYIVIFEPEANASYERQAGHIVITNGYGQGFSDATDNLGWGIYSNNKSESGKGEHGTFKVYKLSDNWKVSDGKLVLRT